MSTCNWLNLESLWSQPVMPKKIPDHWYRTWLVELFMVLPWIKIWKLECVFAWRKETSLHGWLHLMLYPHGMICARDLWDWPFISKVVKKALDAAWRQWSGRFLGIIGWDPSVCKSNRLHVHILGFSIIELRYIPYIILKLLVIFLQSWTSTGYFSNSTGSFVTNCRFILITGPGFPCIVRRLLMYLGTGLGSWLWMGERWLVMSLRNNRLKLETSGELPIILDESIRISETNESIKTGRCEHVTNRLDLECSLGSWPTDYAQKLTSRALVYTA